MTRSNSVRLASLLLLLGLPFFLASCSKNSASPTSWQGGTSLSTANRVTPVQSLNDEPENPRAAVMPAYYDSTLFTINFMELSPVAESSILAHNSAFNIIYQSDPGLPGNQPFISVIDAVPGDGFNPLWQEVQVVFNSGFTPHQFYSDDQIINAAKGPNPEITLAPTDEVYRCSVVGQKPKLSE